jgi:protein with PEP-CTERM/exosortase system signal
MNHQPKEKSMSTLKKLLLLTAAVSFMAAGTANASTIVYNLTSDHCTGGCLTGQTNGGTITITDTAGGISFNVTLSDGNEFVNTGFPLTFGFNLDGITQITYGGLNTGWLIPDVVPVNKQNAGTYHMDGLGDFEYGVLWSLQGGGNATPGPLTFTIIASGLTTSSLQANALGQFFAVDILSGTTGNTGLLDASLARVPDGGSTIVLLGSALMAFGVLRRRFS